MAVRLPTPHEGLCLAVCCLDEPCSLTLRHVDENRCEDDIFDIYLLWVNDVGTLNERFIATINLVSTPAGCCGYYYDEETEEEVECPQTTIDVPLVVDPSELSPCCKMRIQLRLTGENCCSTYTRFSIIGPGGEVFSSYFGPEGLDEEFDIREICNPAP